MVGDQRVTQTKNKVITVTKQMLCDGGLHSLSIEGVAKESKVAKTTIYRHWEQLDDIIFEALSTMSGLPEEFDTGIVQDDVLSSMKELIKCFNDEAWAKVMPDIMERSMRDPKFKVLKKEFMSVRLTPLARAVDRGIASGQLIPETNRDLLMMQLQGPLFLDFMGGYNKLNDELLEELTARTLQSYLVA